MPLTLSSRDLEHAARAIHLLATPLDQPCVNSWRSEVNRCLRDLLNADSAGFILPGVAGPVVYSDEHDPESLTRYPDWLPPPLPSGKPVFAHVIELGVATLEEAYAGHADVYLRSAYYNEYAGRNGAHDALSGLISLGGADPRSAAGLQFWHDSPVGRKFAEREAALLRLVFPAFRAGVEAQMRWERHRTDLLSTLDGLGQATMVCDAAGRTLHQTPALTAAMAADAERDALRMAMEEVAVSISAAGTSALVHTLALAGALSSEFSTRYARYRISGALYRSPLSSAMALALVSLERITPVLRTEQELREALGLTRTECRVASLLLSRTNDEIARELYMSPHTVRRHTERILFKLTVRSRSEVAFQLLC
jgi:DNA-binding CsgD family transcriptional regulator